MPIQNIASDAQLVLIAPPGIHQGIPHPIDGKIPDNLLEYVNTLLGEYR